MSSGVPAPGGVYDAPALPSESGPFMLPPITDSTSASRIMKEQVDMLEAWAGVYVVEYWSVWLPFLVGLVLLAVMLARLGIVVGNVLDMYADADEAGDAARAHAWADATREANRQGRTRGEYYR